MLVIVKVLKCKILDIKLHNITCKSINNYIILRRKKNTFAGLLRVAGMETNHLLFLIILSHSLHLAHRFENLFLK